MVVTSAFYHSVIPATRVSQYLGQETSQSPSESLIIFQPLTQPLPPIFRANRVEVTGMKEFDQCCRYASQHWSQRTVVGSRVLLGLLRGCIL
nr:hypothetical protein L203_03432 [Cryptococcus depauperatus CBS 7841]